MLANRRLCDRMYIEEPSYSLSKETLINSVPAVLTAGVALKQNWRNEQIEEHFYSLVVHIHEIPESWFLCDIYEDSLCCCVLSTTRRAQLSSIYDSWKGKELRIRLDTSIGPSSSCFTEWKLSNWYGHLERVGWSGLTVLHPLNGWRRRQVLQNGKRCCSFGEC